MTGSHSSRPSSSTASRCLTSISSARAFTASSEAGASRYVSSLSVTFSSGSEPRRSPAAPSCSPNVRHSQRSPMPPHDQIRRPAGSPRAGDAARSRQPENRRRGHHRARAASRARWFAQDEASVVAAFGSDAEHGLSQAEAAARLAQYGPNQITGEKPPSVSAVALAQLREPMNIMLIAVTAVSFVIGEVPTAIVVALLILLNVVLGSRQELKARASVDALSKMQVPQSRVRARRRDRGRCRPPTSCRATSSRSRPATSSRPTAGSSAPRRSRRRRRR